MTGWMCFAALGGYVAGCLSVMVLALYWSRRDMKKVGAAVADRFARN